VRRIEMARLEAAGRILLFPAVCYPAQKEISKK
jgi:hypothetical protein